MARDKCEKCGHIYHDEDFITIRMCKECAIKKGLIDKY